MVLTDAGRTAVAAAHEIAREIDALGDQIAGGRRAVSSRCFRATSPLATDSSA
jgi:DNA-binding transcriptional LysR family regulator